MIVDLPPSTPVRGDHHPAALEEDRMVSAVWDTERIQRETMELVEDFSVSGQPVDDGMRNSHRIPQRYR